MGEEQFPQNCQDLLRKFLLYTLTMMQNNFIELLTVKSDKF